MAPTILQFGRVALGLATRAKVAGVTTALLGLQGEGLILAYAVHKP